MMVTDLTETFICLKVCEEKTLGCMDRLCVGRLGMYSALQAVGPQ